MLCDIYVMSSKLFNIVRSYKVEIEKLIRPKFFNLTDRNLFSSKSLGTYSLAFHDA